MGTQQKKSVKSAALPAYDVKTLNKIAERALYLATQMIHRANERPDKQKGDPKIGGHQSASSSSLHILGALHLVVQSGFDHFAVKPHASPTNHSYNYLLDLLLNGDHSRFNLEQANQAMDGLRKFSQNGEPVFQSYHSHYDPDHHNFLPSGTVGIPPVNLGYLAHAYRFAEEHGYKVPQAHFWALIGDSEYREGSLYEAIPDFAEREIGNLTWIVDYNRQSLDGHRITNKNIMNGTDDTRIERTAVANGWEVIQVRHGSHRKKMFQKPGGDIFQKYIEEVLQDYEFQALLLVTDVKMIREQMLEDDPQLKKFLDNVKDEELYQSLRDLGGHDFEQLIEAMMKSKENQRRPTLIIAHTVKGWGLSSAAACGNHSSLVGESEVEELKKKTGVKGDSLYERFSSQSEEGQYLKKRGDQLYSQIKEQYQLRAENEENLTKQIKQFGPLATSLDINLKMVNYPHTQWMLGQLTAKLTRAANTPLDPKKLEKNQKELTDFEKPFKMVGEYLVSMAPDVGTSTNLNPAMDGKIFGAPTVEDFESDLNVKDNKLPDLVPGEEVSDRFLRFEIAEGNVMSCMGSYGQMRRLLGIPLIPLMTVYDFFVKRALDQFFYNLYWQSSFILVGTPSGVTLSPEGAQHGWKSDFQIPNQITWEPFYCLELDWILVESLRRHFENDNQGRMGVFIRAVTRGTDQKTMLQLLKRQARFKNLSDGQQLCHASFALPNAVDETQVENIADAEILEQVRQDVLKGGYYLIDYRGYAGYEPGDNVVNIFAMGSMGTEAIAASEQLLARGIYANVIMVTCTDLLVGNLAHENGYDHLKNGLGINGDLYLQPRVNGSATPPEIMTLSGRRIPAVSVHDGEPGLLDNLGSIVGVRQESLAVRKHSKCGRPVDVYQYHHIDVESVVEAVGKVLSETALEEVRVSNRALHWEQKEERPNWQELWPTRIHDS
ncbi:MAG: pyruvate dehydrogenase [Bdellovibrionales bacterium]